VSHPRDRSRLPLQLLLAALLLAGATRAAARDAYGPEPAVSPSPDEAAALAIARAHFASRGARPQVSGALVLAARTLAEEAAAGADPARRARLRNALARALAYDPAPMVFTIRATGASWGEELGRALGPGAPTHLGAGVAPAAGGSVIVVLASRRGVRLEPFPRAVRQGERVSLSGQLRSGLCNARVFLSAPSGEVREVSTAGAVWFRATVPLEEPGRYVVEVLADGPQGPTVAGLFPVAAGAASFEEPALPAAPGDPAADGASAVLEALAAARRHHGLAALEPDAALAELAQRHSEVMRDSGILGHVLARERPLTERLGRAGVRFRRVFENVAAAPSALEAHGAAEESPAHLRNILEPGARRVGVGLARDASGRVYLTEVLVQ
jgi:uncharacterized protein YkwD